MLRELLTHAIELEKQILSYCDIKTILAYASINKSTRQVYSEFELKPAIDELRKRRHGKWFKWLTEQNDALLLDLADKSGFDIMYYCNNLSIDRLIDKRQINSAIYLIDRMLRLGSKGIDPMLKLGSQGIISDVLLRSPISDNDLLFNRYYNRTIPLTKDFYRSIIIGRATKIFRSYVNINDLINDPIEHHFHVSAEAFIDDALIVGAFDVADSLMQKTPSKKSITRDVFKKAVSYDDYAFCKFMDKYKLIFDGADGYLLNIVILHCGIEIVKWFLQTYNAMANQHILHEAVKKAAAYGNIDVLEWLNSNPATQIKIRLVSTDFTIGFDFGGFMWLVDKKLVDCTDNFIDKIIEYKNPFEIFRRKKYCSENYDQVYNRMIEFFLPKIASEIRFGYILDSVLEYRKFEHVKFLCQKYEELICTNPNIKITNIFRLINTAVNNAGYEICEWFLEWAKQQHMLEKIPKPICIRNFDPKKDIPILDLLVRMKIKFYFNEWFRFLMKNDGTEILEWINDNISSCTNPNSTSSDQKPYELPYEDIIYGAVRNEYVDVLSWLHNYSVENNLNLFVDNAESISVAISYDCIETLEWFYHFGYFEKISYKMIVIYGADYDTYCSCNEEHQAKINLVYGHFGIYHWLLDHPCDMISLVKKIDNK